MEENFKFLKIFCDEMFEGFKHICEGKLFYIFREGMFAGFKDILRGKVLMF